MFFNIKHNGNTSYFPIEYTFQILIKFKVLNSNTIDTFWNTFSEISIFYKIGALNWTESWLWTDFTCMLQFMAAVSGTSCLRKEGHYFLALKLRKNSRKHNLSWHKRILANLKVIAGNIPNKIILAGCIPTRIYKTIRNRNKASELVSIHSQPVFSCASLSIIVLSAAFCSEEGCCFLDFESGELRVLLLWRLKGFSIL